MRRPFAGLDFLLIFLEGEPTLLRAPPRLQPGRHILGDAQRRNARSLQDSDGFFRIGNTDQPVFPDRPSEPGRQTACNAFQAQTIGHEIRHNVQAPGAVLLSLPEKPPMTRFQMEDGRFDMLARAQSVDAEIDASARKTPLRNAADFNSVGQPAGGFYREVRKDRKIRVKVPHPQGFRACAVPAPGDLLLVRGAPVVNRRQLRLEILGVLHIGILLVPPMLYMTTLIVTCF